MLSLGFSLVVRRRKLFWKPMKELVGLPATAAAATAASSPLPTEVEAAKVPA